MTIKNKFFVKVDGRGVLIGNPPIGNISKKNALVLAAWLIFISGSSRKEVNAIFEAIKPKKKKRKTSKDQKEAVFADAVSGISISKIASKLKLKSNTVIQYLHDEIESKIDRCVFNHLSQKKIIEPDHLTMWNEDRQRDVFNQISLRYIEARQKYCKEVHDEKLAVCRQFKRLYPNIIESISKIEWWTDKIYNEEFA